jgi:hypothetical protein
MMPIGQTLSSTQSLRARTARRSGSITLERPRGRTRYVATLPDPGNRSHGQTAPDAPPSYDSVVPEASTQHYRNQHSNTSRSLAQGGEDYGTRTQYTAPSPQIRRDIGPDYVTQPAGSIYAVRPRSLNLCAPLEQRLPQTTATCGKTDRHTARKAAKAERKALRREHKNERRALKAERRYERDMLRAGQAPEARTRCKSISC